LLLTFMPIEGILAIDVVTAMFAVVPLLFIPIPQPVRKLDANGEQVRTSFLEEFKEGFRYVFSWPGLMIIGLMATVINLMLNPGFSLLPILVTKHFNGGAFQLAWLNSAFGIGLILGGLLLSIWGGFKRRVWTSLTGLVGLGLGSLFMGLVPSNAYLLAVGLMFWLGFVNPITNGPLLAAVQAVVDPEMQGRVFTLIMSVAGAMSPIGLAIAGPVADRFGIQTWFLIGGVVTLVMAFSMMFIPAVVNFEKGRGVERNGVGPETEELQDPVVVLSQND